MKNKKITKGIAIALLMLVVAYFGGGDEYVAEAVSGIQNKVGTWITSEPYDARKVAKANRLKGKVTHVSDGDTVTLIDEDGKKQKIRLNGIDAPEIGQPYGKESKDFLKKLVFNKSISLDIIDIDQYNRILGIVYLDNMNVNEELLRNGLAWKYRFNNSETYDRLVRRAQAQQLNIWSESNPIDPYIWRKQNKR